MTSLLLSQSLERINIGGVDTLFANKDSTIPPAGVNKPLNPNTRYYLITEFVAIQWYRYQRAQHGAYIYINDQALFAPVFTTGSDYGQIFRSERWIQGSNIKFLYANEWKGHWNFPTAPSHHSISKFELYWN